MNPLIWIGFLAFFVVSLVVGVRLLLLWFRTRELPELLIGIGVLGIGPVGFGGMMAASVVASSRPGLSEALFCLSFLTVATGVVAKCLFNVRVYHPGSRGLVVLTALVVAFYAAVFAERLLGGGFSQADHTEPLRIVQSWVQIGPLLWGSVEALRYWQMMRRRLRLGLADPVVTNRFLMWGIGAGAAGVGTAVGTVNTMLTGASTIGVPWVVASSSAHGFAAAVALSLAFLPPASYLALVRRRAATPAANG